MALTIGCQPKDLTFEVSGSDSISGSILNFSSISSASTEPGAQSTCVGQLASLYSLDAQGKKGTKLLESAVDSSGNFSFSGVRNLGIDVAKDSGVTKYVIEFSCGSSTYQRFVTGALDQKLSDGTTLMAWVSQTDASASVRTQSAQSWAEFYQTLESAGSVTAAFSALNSNTTLKAKFQTLFGVDPAVLNDAVPKVKTTVVPSSFSEEAGQAMSVQATHWSSTYNIAYAWKIGSSTLSNASNFTYTHSANTQGSHTIQLFIGQNNGSGGIDTTKPYTQETFPITIQNSVPPLAPGISRITSQYTTSLSATVRIATGALIDGRPQNCKSFSNLALVEESFPAIGIAPLLSSSYDIDCTTATQQDVNVILSGTEGVRVLRMWARDAAGNISSTSQDVSVVLDRISPSLTLTSLHGGQVVRGGSVTAITWAATELNPATNPITLDYTLNNGSTWTTIAASIADTGTYSWSVPAVDSAAAKVRITMIDKAGNSGSVVSASLFAIDSTAPTVAISAPIADATMILASSVSSFTFSGTCSEANQTVTLTGSVSAAASCIGGTWTVAIDLSSLPDGLLSVTASQSDVAGNVAITATRSAIKDTTSPIITVTTPNTLLGNGTTTISWQTTELNVPSGATFAVSVYDGSNWINVGTKPAIAGSNSNYTYTLSSLSVPNVESTTSKVRVVLTDAAGNSTTSESNVFAIDNSPPTVSAFILNNGVATTGTNSIPVAFSSQSNTGGAKITHFCLKYNSATTPAANDSCWNLLSRSDINVTPATNISVSNFYFSVGFSALTYNTYVWTMDEVQQISAPASASITLLPGTPPTITDVIVANQNAPALPLTSDKMTFSLGSDVYIYWNVSDVEGLAANSVKIEYSFNDTDWVTVATGLSEISQTGCTLLASSNGCYKWTAGAPSDDGTGTPAITADDVSFKIRITAKDSSNMSATGTSVNVNSGRLFLIGGNTNPGLNGSSSSAVFMVNSNVDSVSNAIVSLTSKGELFFLDYSRGLLYVSPTNGVQTLLMPINSSFGTENGPVSTASLKSPYKIAMDYADNIYIFDWDRIRKINTNVSPMTINTIIGGGSNIGMATMAASEIQITPTDFGTAINGAVLQVLGNGDIWFSTEPSAAQTTNRKRVRQYKKSDGNVYSYNISGTGNSAYASLDLTNSTTTIRNWALAYDTNSFQINKFIVNSAGPAASCTQCGLSAVDPVNLTAQTPHPPTAGSAAFTSYYTGMDGKIYYISNDTTRIYKYNTATNTVSVVYGTSAGGYCAAGTAATSCTASIGGLFVNRQGKLFVVDNNLVRTIDDNLLVQDVFGQSLSYGHNTLATNARFKEVSSIGVWYDSVLSKTKVIATDRYGYRLKEFAIGGEIRSIAGTGVNLSPSKSVDAATQPVTTSGANGSANNAHLIVDPADGTIYKGFGSNQNYKLQRGVPDTWQNMVSVGSGPFVNMDSDALVGSPITAGNVTFGNYSTTAFLGMSSGSMLMLDHDYDSAATQHRGGAILEYDRANITLEKIAGKYGQPNSSFSFCANGTLPTSCVGYYSLMNPGTGYTNAHYDAYLDAWIIATVGSTAVRILKKGANMSTLVNVSAGIRSLAYNRVGGASPSKQKLWYCSTTGVLREYDLLTGTETALSWKISNMTCYNNYLIYSPERNSLIFPVKQNGLAGIGEYMLP